MIFSETNVEISKALVKAWGEMNNPKHNASVTVRTKSGSSYKFDYTDLNGIFDEARKVFKEHGISIIQNSYTEIIDTRSIVSVETLFLHESGEWVKSLPLKFPAAQSMQDFGGQITYMKRYSLSAMLGISTEKDDDANGASGNSYEYQKRNTQQYKQQSQPINNNITPAQSKALRAKLNNIAHVNGQDLQTVYISALRHLKMPDDTNSKTLTKGQASDIIGYLTTLEPQKA